MSLPLRLRGHCVDEQARRRPYRFDTIQSLGGLIAQAGGYSRRHRLEQRQRGAVALERSCGFGVHQDADISESGQR